MVEIGVDKNSTIVFPAPLMSTIGELGTFLSREGAAAGSGLPPAPVPPVPAIAETEKAAGAPPRANGEFVPG